MGNFAVFASPGPLGRRQGGAVGQWDGETEKAFLSGTEVPATRIFQNSFLSSTSHDTFLLPIAK
jgi:hypothetical protein